MISMAEKERFKLSRKMQMSCQLQLLCKQLFLYLKYTIFFNYNFKISSYIFVFIKYINSKKPYPKLGNLLFVLNIDGILFQYYILIRMCTILLLILYNKFVINECKLIISNYSRKVNLTWMK